MILIIILLGYFVLFFALEKLEHELRWRLWVIRHPRAYRLVCRAQRILTLIGWYGLIARPLLLHRDRKKRKREEEEVRRRLWQMEESFRADCERRERMRQAQLARRKAKEDAHTLAQQKQEMSPETALSEGLKDFL